MIQEDQIQHTSLLYLSQPVAELAEKLVAEAPEGIDRTSFTNSGSEANELAILASRQSTGENIVVSLRHGYHGGTSATLASCGHHTWRFRSQPVASTVSALEPNCYRCPFGQTQSSCNLECAKNVETTIQTTTHGEIAAFIAEPVMGVGGFISPPREYFSEVAKIVHNYGGKYISDEVQTGAGRGGGQFLMTKELGIDADLITMAKGFGNGAAIGAVLMKSEVADSMKGQLLMEGFQDLMRDFSLIGDVRGRGLLIGIELVKDRKTKAYASEEAALFMDYCKDQGLLLGKGGLFGNVVRIAPPLNINSEEVKFMLSVMRKSFEMLERRG